MEQLPDFSNGRNQKQRLAAFRMLAKLEHMEELARTWENMEAAFPDMQQWEIEGHRSRFASTYERLSGVHPAERHALRRKLERVLQN